MGGELVDDTPNSISGVSTKVVTNSPFPYKQMFDSWCPYYLMLGMTYDQYWHGDPEMVIYYREMDQLKRDMKNQELWLQGRYIYDALLMVAPLFNSNSKRGTKATPYHEEPYPITDNALKAQEERKAREEYERNKARMEVYMCNVNSYFQEQKRGEVDGINASRSD